MKARIIILPTGQISVFVEEGSFEDGKLAIAQLLAGLSAEGIEFTNIEEPEQHRHEGEQVRSHVHA